MIPTDISDQFEQPGKLHVQCTQPSNCLSPRLSAFLSQPHRPFGISKRVHGSRTQRTAKGDLRRGIKLRQSFHANCWSMTIRTTPHVPAEPDRQNELTPCTQQPLQASRQPNVTVPTGHQMAARVIPRTPTLPWARRSNQAAVRTDWSFSRSKHSQNCRLTQPKFPLSHKPTRCRILSDVLLRHCDANVSTKTSYETNKHTVGKLCKTTQPGTETHQFDQQFMLINCKQLNCKHTSGTGVHAGCVDRSQLSQILQKRCQKEN